MKGNKAAAAGILKRIVSLLTSMVKAKTLALKSKTNALRTRIIIFSLLSRNKKILMSTISHKLHSLIMGQQQPPPDDDHIGYAAEEEEEEEEEEEDQSNNNNNNVVVLYNHNSISLPNPMLLQNNVSNNASASASAAGGNHRDEQQAQLYEVEDEGQEEDGDEDNDDSSKYPALTHSVFVSLEDLDYFDGEEEEDPAAGSGSVIDLVKNSKQRGGEEFRLEDEIDHLADLFIKRFHRQMRIQKQLSFKRYQDMLQRSV